MSYKVLLFDLDDTLLDFGANEIDSLNKLFHQNGYTFSDELFRVYDSLNRDREGVLLGISSTKRPLHCLSVAVL